MRGVILHNISVMFQSFLRIILGLMEDLGESKMSRNALGVETQAVLKVFLSLCIFAHVGELGSEMDSCSEVL